MWHLLKYRIYFRILLFLHQPNYLKTSIPVQIRFLTCVFPFVIRSSIDLALLENIFLKEEYLLPTDFIPKIVIDLGANIGLSALYFRAKYPLSRIIAVEPDPKNLVSLHSNIVRAQGIDVVPRAIHSKNGLELELFRDPMSHWSTSSVQKK